MSLPTRNLRWLAALALLPVALIAAVALRSLRSDQDAIEAAAQRELGSLSARLVAEIENQLVRIPLLSGQMPFAKISDTRIAETESSSTWWRLDASGETVDFFFAPEVPIPPSWWLQMTEAQRSAYRELTRDGADPTNSPARSVDLPAIAQEVLRFERHRWSPKFKSETLLGGPAPVLLPSGLSIKEAALWQKLNAGIDTSTLGYAQASIYAEQPGSWSELREFLSAEKSAANWSENSIQDLIRLGDFRAGEREKLAAWRRQWPASEWSPGGRWVSVGTNWFLAVLAPELPAITNEPSSAVSRWILLLMPGATVSQLVGVISRQLAPETPPYTRGRVWFADRVWNLHPTQDWRTAPPPGLGLFRKFQWRLPGGGEFTGWAGYEIADRALLLSDHRRRSWTLGSLIIAAALVSVLGFWQMQRALEHQRRLAEQQANFVSSVSHELRAPVASVGLMIEMLRGDTLTEPARRTQYLSLIARECRRLGQLIQNVLATRRLERGGEELALEALDLGRLMKETVEGFLPLATEQRVAVELPPQFSGSRSGSTNGLYEVLGDSLALQQALTNLLDNALKHTPAGGAISVDLKLVDDGRRVQLTITDNGPGVPPEDRERIFERFYRRGSELRRETEGIGLGLALVRNTAKAHGGTVRCESTDTGTGARFVLELPLTGH